MKYDLQIENFRRFFDYKMMQITPAQRERLPPELLVKIFDKNGEPSTKILTFMEQMYALTQTGISVPFVLVEDDGDEGIGVPQFEWFKKNEKRKRHEGKEVESYLNKGVFVICGKDIAGWVNHINGASLSGIMNYTLKLKKTKNVKLADVEAEFVHICNLLSKYESNKKNIIKRENLTMPDIYTLLYLADGNEKSGAYMYLHGFKNAINASRIQIYRAFEKMCVMGYVTKTGSRKKRMYKITYLGKSAINSFLKKYVLP